MSNDNMDNNNRLFSWFSFIFPLVGLLIPVTVILHAPSFDVNWNFYYGVINYYFFIGIGYSCYLAYKGRKIFFILVPFLITLIVAESVWYFVDLNYPYPENNFNQNILDLKNFIHIFSGTTPNLFLLIYLITLNIFLFKHKEKYANPIIHNFVLNFLLFCSYMLHYMLTLPSYTDYYQIGYILIFGIPLTGLFHSIKLFIQTNRFWYSLLPASAPIIAFAIPIIIIIEKISKGWSGFLGLIVGIISSAVFTISLVVLIALKVWPYVLRIWSKLK